MKPPKCYVIITNADGVSTTKVSFEPFAAEVRRAKERVIALCGSGAAVSISVVENVNTKRFETTGCGEVRIR
jgi:hypothetical protein